MAVRSAINTCSNPIMSPLLAAECSDLRVDTRDGAVDARENSVGCPPGVEIDTLVSAASVWRFATSDELLVVLIICSFSIKD